MPLPICPDCRAQETTLVGSIPATDIFAGRVLERPLAGGALYRCRQCRLGFRWPRPGKENLDALYAGGHAQTWSTGIRSRADWHIARRWIAEHIPAGSHILDIGCFDGGFMDPLVGHYRCHGIEIHPEARERAKRKGLHMVGRDFSVVAGSFDVITAFDVIEHMERPQTFIAGGLAALRPGGVLLISTGNLDAITFRLLGSRYWYCTIAEHISFVSPSWFAGLAEALDYRIVSQARFSHGDDFWWLGIREAANNMLYWASGAGFRGLRRLGMGGKDVKTHPELLDHPPAWGSARDHVMVLVQKR